VPALAFWLNTSFFACSQSFVGLPSAPPPGRRFLAAGRAITETLFSRSDNAKSCLMISPFSHFCAFLGSPAHVFAKIANTARAVPTPMSTTLIIYAVLLACAVKVEAEILYLVEL
jgi:hypothetical protein